MKRLPWLVSGLAVLSGSMGACGGEPEPRAPLPKAPVSSILPSASASASAAPNTTSTPMTEKKPVTDDYHGTKVVDDYRWLEDSKDAAVQAWSAKQTGLARARLDAAPGRDALRARLTELLSSAGPDHFGLGWKGKQLFALKDQPPKQQPLLVVLKSEGSPTEAPSEKVVLDPNVLDAKGSTTIDWFSASRDGKKIAVSLSEHGSESGTVHVYDVATGKELDTPIPRVHGGTAGGSLAWNQEGTGFWYTRYPREGERPAADLDFYQQVWFHTLGDKTDKRALEQELPRIAEIELQTSKDGRWVVAVVANGDGGEHAIHLLDTKSKTKTWTEVARFADRVVAAELAEDGGLWLRSLKDAPRGKLLRLDPTKPDLAKATVVVPESDAVIQFFEITKDKLWVADLVAGPSQLRLFDLKGKSLGTVAIPPVSAIRAIVAVDGTDDVLIRAQSFTDPPAWYRVRGKKPTDAPRKTALFLTSKADFGDTEVVRETCVSKDGTKVPLNVMRRKGVKLDGNLPTLLYGYGGYSVSLVPRFQPKYRPWLDAGGVLAIANLRGGGELGDAWHEAGKLTKKQNVFDDFQACATHLGEAGYTKPARLAIMGGSNGGLLMGAALTQHPESFRAVVAMVGIFDMLRVETTPNGAFNVTEFGTVKDKAQFDALYAYSPLHRVKDGVAYPATLFMTGANDPRVDPYHSRKMVARLQAANPSGTYLLRTSGDTGHGMGTPLKAQIEEEVDIYAFLFEQLGVSYSAK